MAKSKYKVIWTDIARKDLKEVYDFYKIKSVQGAKNVILDIRKSTKSIHYSEQTQVEPYNPNYRRIIVRHFKILYKVIEEKNILYVYGVIDTKKNPVNIEKY